MLYVIIPTICRDTLDASVKSLQVQTNPVWKAIIVGDGVMPPQYDDERIKSIAAPHFKNAALTRNYALRGIPDALKSLNDWVAFLDDDDVFTPNYVEDFYKENQGWDVFIFQMDLNGSLKPSSDLCQRQELVYGHVGISFAMKMDIFKVFHFTPVGELGNEDYNMLFDLWEAKFKIKFFPKLGYIVRPHMRGMYG